MKSLAQAAQKHHEIKPEQAAQRESQQPKAESPTTATEPKAREADKSSRTAAKRVEAGEGKSPTLYTTITLTSQSISRMSWLQMEALKVQGEAGLVPRPLSTSEKIRLALLVVERIGSVTVDDLRRFKSEDARSSSWGEKGARRAAWRKGKAE